MWHGPMCLTLRDNTELAETINKTKYETANVALD